MHEVLIAQLQAENDQLKRRIAELEHAYEVHEWGGQLFHESNIPQLMLDSETGTILAANAAARTFYGDTLIGRGNVMCLCAEGLDWERDVQPLFAQGRYGKKLARQHTASGEVRIVEAHFTRITIRGRAVIHLSCLDVTDRVRIQEELELSHNRYRAFIQLSSESIWRDMMTEPIPVQLPVEEQIDLIFERSYLAECNLAFARAWDANFPDELIGTFTRERVYPDDLNNRALMRHLILNGYRLDNLLFTARTPTGEEVHQLCSFLGIVHDGLLWGTWGVFRDITELIRTQRALEASEERYRNFINYANEGICRFDKPEPMSTQLPLEDQLRFFFEKAYIGECNRAFARMHGVETPDALVGMRLQQMIDANDANIQSMLKTFVENGYRIEGFVYRRQLEDGSEQYLLCSFLGVVKDGYLISTWGVLTDITELRRLQQELERAYRLESIGRLAGGIAHDFNNVLTAVMGYTELARMRVQDEAVLRYLEGIQKAAERAADLNKQLLAYARKQVVQPAPTNLGEWLQGALEMLRRVLPESVRLNTQIEPTLWRVNADSNLLLQIVLNLVVNARDAMPNGGTITLRLRNKTVRRTRTRTIPNGRYVVLEVEDTGTGIPPEVLPKIFEPFYTTKPLGQGTGMGLSAVQGAVQQLGGYIEVQTAVGKGTRFSIYFPRIEPPKSAA
ncbi:MAG: ATP-binding protein [Fimbriimonadales bacterium]